MFRDTAVCLYPAASRVESLEEEGDNEWRIVGDGFVAELDGRDSG